MTQLVRVRGIALDAARLRHEALRRGLTVATLASAAGLSASVVRKAMAGEPLDVTTIYAIAEVFDKAAPSRCLSHLLPDASGADVSAGVAKSAGAR